MPASPALTLPIWFQALLGVIAILGFLAFHHLAQHPPADAAWRTD
jgi:hypothetical protein